VHNRIVSSTGKPSATVAIPTRDRPDYLEVTLVSVVPQAERAGAEVLVISDGDAATSRQVAGRHGVRVVGLSPARGLNAARNAAFREGAGDLVVLIDDDVRAPVGWIDALLAGVRAAPEHGVFGGPIRAVLEGGGPRACGRESAPITTLDLGPADRDADLVWGSNMAIRRDAFERVGPFDETIFGLRGDEEEWERRYVSGGGRVRYIAGAGLEHRRTREDSTVRALSRAAYGHGRAARRHDARHGAAPALRSELRTLIGCVWHTFRRRCAFGITMAVHSAGRLREAVAGE
jgi:glycosyltransferase involved in cell wall biosynthesis